MIFPTDLITFCTYTALDTIFFYTRPEGIHFKVLSFTFKRIISVFTLVFISHIVKSTAKWVTGWGVYVMRASRTFSTQSLKDFRLSDSDLVNDMWTSLILAHEWIVLWGQFSAVFAAITENLHICRSAFDRSEDRVPLPPKPFFDPSFALCERFYPFFHVSEEIKFLRGESFCLNSICFCDFWVGRYLLLMLTDLVTVVAPIPDRTSLMK